MSEHRCETCRHWGRNKPASNPAALPFNDWYPCDLTYGEGHAQTVPESSAYGQTVRGGGAYLVTKAEFGCVQWEAQETP